ncbi:MAG: ABC transporter permease, partial [Olsenella sp.]
FASAQATLDASAEKLASSRADLDDDSAQYEDGVSAYEDQKADADQQLADAQAQVDAAQADVDDLEAPDIYVLDRTQNEGVVTYDDDTRRMDSIADVFPLIFFLVAALVSLTTMTRMVEDDRVEIGTFKALGYSTARIAEKYLIYAAIAGVSGAVLGILVLTQVLPTIITSSYAIIYAVPRIAFPKPIDPACALLSGGLGVGVTLLATWGAVVSSLRETPATLMLPRAPKAGKRILLERLTPLWSRISFSWKVTFRNLFRYKRRFLMTVIGISGCTALLLVGFGLHDSIWDIIDCQYGSIIHYNMVVGLLDDATTTDVDAVASYLDEEGDASGTIRVQQENMRAGSNTGAYDGTLLANVVIPEDSGTFGGAVTLDERVSHAAVAFDDDAVVVTEKLATKLGVGVGDTIVLFDQDDVGNATGDGHPLTITGICENYVSNYVYVGREAWRGVDEGEPVFSTLYTSIADDANVRSSLSEDLGVMNKVSTVSFTDEIINRYRKMLSVVDLIVLVLIVSAAALAFIVLYNLTNINVEERVREIASLKVLGFT